jgi:hypothetical protein
MKHFVAPMLALVLAVSSFAPTAASAGLQDYKKQKHEPRAEVTSESCETAYTRDCSAKCASGDAACAQGCTKGAPAFCEAREDRRSTKKLELFAKGASLGAGAVGMLFDDKMGEVAAGGDVAISEYAVIWNRPSLTLDAGAGYLDSGTKLATMTTAFRYRAFGLSGSVDYLWDQTDHLAEVDFGPTFYLGTAHFLFGLQPSALLSTGNDVLPEWGGGLRTLTTYMNGQFFAYLNPMLGKMNRNWLYDLKVGVGYRLTPAMQLSAGYSYRDVVDLNDLDISSASLQGAFLRLGVRMN